MMDLTGDLLSYFCTEISLTLLINDMTTNSANSWMQLKYQVQNTANKMDHFIMNLYM